MGHYFGVPPHSPRPLGIPSDYRGHASDADFLGHLAVMETLSLPAGRPRPWKRAVVIEDTASRPAAEYPQWLSDAPRVAAEDFELRWQQITRRLETSWINIVPTAIEGDTLVVVVEYVEALGDGPFRRPEEVSIPGHSLPPSRLSIAHNWPTTAWMWLRSCRRRRR
jgi:hypothetical protein